jgi:YD repeat-containing protein
MRNSFRSVGLALLLGMCRSSSAWAQEELKMEYDALGRLVKVTNQSGPNVGTNSAYSYDAAGNRSNVTVTGAQKRFVVVPLNGFTIIPLN